MKTINKILAFAAILLLGLGCANNSGKKQSQEIKYRDFPVPKMPSLYTDSASQTAYIAANLWSQYLSGEGVTDSVAILGVPRDKMESQMAFWIKCLDAIPLKEAQNDIDKLFTQIEQKQMQLGAEDHFFLRFTEMVCKYMYDPNSPMRDEDLFLPFVRRLAVSPLTEEDMRAGYEYQAKMCALNPRFSVAPDFAYTTAKGRRGTLHQIKSGVTLIFFSNPGCTACREILDAICSRQYLSRMISEGHFAVLNLYIDEELDKWYEYMTTYPTNWINAYEHKGTIRNDQIYDIRAIPSLYLLDEGKHIVMKDAPLEKLLLFLDEYAQYLYGQQQINR